MTSKKNESTKTGYVKYLDPSVDIEERVNDLLSRMTIDEKINQMYTVGVNEIDELLARAESGEPIDISCTFAYFGFNVENFNRLQKHQVENTRLHIPILFACENTHGVSNPLCTIFPTSGCLAATFEPSLARRFAEASSKEGAALGIRQFYSPNVDISWDQRWGRVEENFGEDPYLTSVMAAEEVKGFQNNKVAATVKHYIAYGVSEGGINLAPIHLGELDVREYMLPAFKACVDAGAWSLMPTYNELDGVPVHASKKYMQDILRGELGFDGMVVTDYGASNMLGGFHRVVDRPVEAGYILCDNRVNMEASDYYGYNNEFREAVKSGAYPEEKVDACVADILRLKFRAGLFEDPYAHPEKIAEIHNDENRALAREVAEKGIVLLKNDGVLPLKKEMKAAVIGPNGNIAQLGDYIYYRSDDENYKGKCVSEESPSLYAAMKQAGVDVAFAEGCGFERMSEEMLKRAKKVAADSDVVILALGDNSKGGKYGGNQDGLAADEEMAVTSGEGYDLDMIELTPWQQTLLKEVKKVGKPIVVVLYGGRPKALAYDLDDMDALLFAFGAGECGNEAITDILFGKVNPSGKLPISFPRTTGTLPCYYNCKPSARGTFYQRHGSKTKAGRDYVFETPDALFPFGFGLSYTEYAYSNLVVEENADGVTVGVKVKNVGKVDGEESVLLFLSAKTQRVTPVVKKLRAFKRIALAADEEKTVEFKLGDEDFEFVDEDGKRRVAHTEFTVFVGDKTARFSVK